MKRVFPSTTLQGNKVPGIVLTCFRQLVCAQGPNICFFFVLTLRLSALLSLTGSPALHAASWLGKSHQHWLNARLGGESIQECLQCRCFLTRRLLSTARWALVAHFSAQKANIRWESTRLQFVSKAVCSLLSWGLNLFPWSLLLIIHYAHTTTLAFPASPPCSQTRGRWIYKGKVTSLKW